MSKEIAGASAGAAVGQESSQETPYQQVEVTVKSLLEAGAHYGHQSDKWNPKMLPFLYGVKNNIHIINLDQTMSRWEKARKAIVDVCALGGNVLFVGTKLQARETIKQHATRCGASFVITRWLGGTLSNFQTVKKSIERMRRMEDLLAKANDESSDVKLSKKEKLNIARQIEKLEANLGGLRGLRKPPELVFIVDVTKESIAVAESKRLHVPVVALVDSNANPQHIAHPIPSNDDATKAITLFSAAVADAVIEGRKIYDARAPRELRDGGDSIVVIEKGDATNGHANIPAQEMSAGS
jgi:small subunit ribosomal protein S2